MLSYSSRKQRIKTWLKTHGEIGISNNSQKHLKIYRIIENDLGTRQRYEQIKNRWAIRLIVIENLDL